eukprot:jgi/Chrzof1/13371/Cz07g30160.t1
MQDNEEKIKKRQEIVAGPLQEKLRNLQEKIIDAAPGEYVAGDKLSIGDLGLFVQLSTFISGFMDGVPKDLYKDYPKIEAYRKKIANHDKVKAFYAKETDDIRQAFKA